MALKASHGLEMWLRVACCSCGGPVFNSQNPHWLALHLLSSRKPSVLFCSLSVPVCTHKQNSLSLLLVACEQSPQSGPTAGLAVGSALYCGLVVTHPPTPWAHVVKHLVSRGWCCVVWQWNLPHVGRSYKFVAGSRAGGLATCGSVLHQEVTNP